MNLVSAGFLGQEALLHNVSVQPGVSSDHNADIIPSRGSSNIPFAIMLLEPELSATGHLARKQTLLYLHTTVNYFQTKFI